MQQLTIQKEQFSYYNAAKDKPAHFTLLISIAENCIEWLNVAVDTEKELPFLSSVLHALSDLIVATGYHVALRDKFEVHGKLQDLRLQLMKGCLPESHEALKEVLERIVKG